MVAKKRERVIGLPLRLSKNPSAEDFGADSRSLRFSTFIIYYRVMLPSMQLFVRKFEREKYLSVVVIQVEVLA